MRISKLLEQYDFHDSLLEKIYFRGEQLVLEIDFCKWRQDSYVEGEDETEEIMIVFKNVSDVTIPKLKLNSDEIMGADLINDDVGRKGIKLTVFNDIKQTVYFVIIYAEDVHIEKV